MALAERIAWHSPPCVTADFGANSVGLTRGIGDAIHSRTASRFQEISIMEQILTNIWRENPSHQSAQIWF